MRARPRRWLRGGCRRASGPVPARDGDRLVAAAADRERLGHRDRGADAGGLGRGVVALDRGGERQRRARIALREREAGAERVQLGRAAGGRPRGQRPLARVQDGFGRGRAVQRPEEVPGPHECERRLGAFARRGQAAEHALGFLGPAGGHQGPRLGEAGGEPAPGLQGRAGEGLFGAPGHVRKDARTVQVFRREGGEAVVGRRGAGRPNPGRGAGVSPTRPTLPLARAGARAAGLRPAGRSRCRPRAT
jgi:hypothetical protein